MIKRVVKDVHFDGESFVEREKTVWFAYNLRAVRMYEQSTGNNFFAEYNKALQSLFAYFGKGKKVSELSSERLSNSLEAEEIFGILADPVLCEFLTDFVPCMYVEIVGGSTMQNDTTLDACSYSNWFMGLISFDFLLEIMTVLEKFNEGEQMGRVPAKNPLPVSTSTGCSVSDKSALNGQSSSTSTT